ncbi:serine/threonine-protein phosphatase Pgam5, mitochondrial-like [Nilaparvata lugens]|uniref:serine/threonine-protein phosphatase Pgam5, mitochondrial-like n=1 Tax=Nilaparvata lugens TaxID=108931 RepID=UPI000B97F01D|nr:serine/threonine-protein phosphatase Pgam5, mitochondrial isoform X1 [Nilaparvata lugens]XP_039290941.1 serine/threonine-protein phosphatase Pgam5, mitochondrial isoform X2 [Nilaparvata lugens]XP_039290942.1 serine/threonine-protein phosphatase Pgam5, mitochondrial isoform X1 [Nilaparvata lugens]XP_039290943.1 serine/threonine-protein phosphatase Pgam5, mitochondrial-like [Nilaparvata lugens]XP_039290944.1 serine/threonine-protein phosphatase Pgam5, mitochondrial-like [Nilaparvata lugens]
MTVISRLQKYLLTGLSICGGAVITHYGLNQNQDHRAYTAWTTNYVPEVKWDHNWDKREPESLVKPPKNGKPVDENAYNEMIEQKKSKAVRHLILIRHGQYNLSGKVDKERVLTELGRNQATETGKRLKLLDFPYTRIIRSTLTRAQETGALIAKELPGVEVTDDSLLEEGSPIPVEPPVGHWKPEASYTFQDGPRIEAAFRKYFHRARPDQTEDSYDVIVCHGNVIRYFVCRALQFPADAWLRFSIFHGSITCISIGASGRVVLRTYSDAGHMPPAYLTTS